MNKISAETVLRYDQMLSLSQDSQKAAKHGIMITCFYKKCKITMYLDGIVQKVSNKSILKNLCSPKTETVAPIPGPSHPASF